MIGGMRQSSFQSRVTTICFYFAEELSSLSSPCKHRSLASRNYFLPSFEELKALAEKASVYTTNTSPTEKFEDIPDVKQYKSSNTVSGDGKAQQGRYIAAHILCPKEVEEMLRLALQRLGK